jgi:DNA-binding response OmpR family regulator
MADKIKILLVEDDTFLVEMYTTKFEIEGFAVIAAEDGQKGLEMAQKESPDIILLDILMPKMDGFAVLDALKKDKALANIPVVLLTNLGQKDDVKKGFEKGAAGYLIKAHFMPSEVVDKIKKILKDSKK